VETLTIVLSWLRATRPPDSVTPPPIVVYSNRKTSIRVIFILASAPEWPLRSSAGLGRAAQREAGGLLVGVADPENGRLVERPADDLEREGQSGRRETAGHAERGEAEPVERPREARE